MKNEIKKKHALQLEEIKSKTIQSKWVFFRILFCIVPKYFHCTSNYSFDQMHDLLEGVVPMTIKDVLKFFTIETQKFTIDYLNAKIYCFDYGLVEKKNKPSANFTVAMLNKKQQIY